MPKAVSRQRPRFLAHLKGKGNALGWRKKSKGGALGLPGDG